MNKGYCYSVQHVDRIMAQIAESLGPAFSTYNATIFATLRGLQDEINGVQPENSVDYDKVFGIKYDKVNGVGQISFENGSVEENLARIRKELLIPLLKLNKSKIAEKSAKLRTLIDNQTSIWDTVNSNYDRLSVFLERVSQMTYYFSQAADVFVKNYNKNNKIPIRIQDVINGITDSNGRVIKDFNGLMRDVYNMFLQDYNNYINGNVDLGNKEETLTPAIIEKEFSKIFNPDVWGAMVLMTKAYLKEVEGLTIDLYNNTAEEAIMKYTSDNDIVSLFSPEESTKEGWQIITDMLSAYSSLTKEVRKVLSNVFLTYVTPDRQVEYVRDTLGYKVRMDPFSAYNLIKEVIRSSCSKEAMMNAISKEPRLADLYETLRSKYYLQTQVYNNFNKIFQLYGQLDDAGSRIVTLNKNNTETVMARYLHALKSGANNYFRRNSIEWNTDSNAVSELREALEAFNPDLKDSLWSLFGTADHQKVVSALEKVKKVLGLDTVFPVTGQEDPFINACTSSITTFRKVCDILWGFANYGGVREMTASNIIEWILGTNDNSKETTEAYKKIKQLVDIVVKKTFNSQFQSQARSIDAKGNKVTLFADVQSNFMGDLLKKLKQYTDLRDLEIKSSKESDFADKLKYIKNSRRAAAAQYLINKFFKGTSFCGRYASEMKFEIEKDKYITLKNVPISDEISCAWLRYLWDDIVTGDMFDADSFTQNFIFQRIVSGKFNDNLSAFENFTGAQHFKTIIDGYFTYDALRNGIMSEFSEVPVFILGDSGVFKMLKVKRATSFSDYKNVGGKLRFDTTKIVDELYKVYKGELRRMRMFQAIVKQEGWTKDNIGEGNKNIFDSQNKFTMLTFLNEALSDKSYDELCDMDVSEVKSLIQNYLNRGFNKFLKFGRDAGVLDANNRQIVTGNEGNKEGGKGLVQYSVLNIKEEQGASAQQVELVERLKEAYYNIYLSNINQFQMFTGDLGFYKNVKDFQKRYKEIHAPGETLDPSVVSPWDQLKLDENGNPMPTFNKYQRAIWVKDMEANMEEMDPGFMAVLLRTFKITDSKTVEDAISNENILTPRKDADAEKQRIARLKELLGNNYRIYDAYVHGTSRTDGQCYRTIDSYRKVQIMRGLWNNYMEAMYREYKKIEESVISEDREITEDEIHTLLKFRTYMQPLKPFTYTFEEYTIDSTDANGRPVKDVINIPVQIKCAECVLLPALFKKGSRLRELGLTMQEKDIDLVGFDSALKVGAYGITDLEAADASGNVNVRTNLMNGTIHNIAFEDMKIQTNVPAHMNVQRGLGTQVRKLILNNLNLAKEYYNYVKDPRNKNKDVESFMYTYGRKRSMNGLGIMNLYNGLIMANMLESFGGFEHLMNNPKKLSKILSSSIINNRLNSFHKLREYAVNDDGEFLVPLHEGASEHDNQGMLYSLYRQRVNKQDMQGGSLVQVTDYGINVVQEVGDSESERPLMFIKSEDGKNVLRAQIEIPFDFKYTDSYGRIQELAFDDYCNADGTFKKNENGEYKIDVDFPGMREIIAYRIPSEREYSMINCEVVRCIPPLAGGIIRVPAQGLTIAGFDFDIDKLYLLRKEFKTTIELENNYSRDELDSIFKRVYEKDIMRRNESYQGVLEEHHNLQRELKRARANKLPESTITDIENRIKEVQSKARKIAATDSIENELRRIKLQKRGKKPLNFYWKEMLEQNPYMQEDPLYNKNLLFMEAAKELGLWKEPVEKEVPIYYDFEMPIDKNPRHARNNVIFDIIKGRLEDPETLQARLTPGGFANSIEVAKEMQVLLFNPELANHIVDGKLSLSYFKNVVKNTEEDSSGDSTMDAADVTTLLYYNQLNQVAGKLIGIFANHNNNQQFTSTLETLSLKNPIVFGQMLKASIKAMSHNASTKNGILGNTLLAKQITLEDGTIVDTDLTLAEFLAAAVDAVKNPVLNYLNFNQTTATPGVLLARMGHSLRDIGLLFNQPIIKEICDLISNGNGLVDFNTAKNQVLNKLLHNSSLYEGKNISSIRKEYNEISIGITTEDLLGSVALWTSKDAQDTKDAEMGRISDTRKQLYSDSKFVSVQLAALKIFEKARNASQELNDLIKSTKFTAANAVGSTTGAFINLEEQVNKFINNKDGELVVHIAERLKEQDAFRVLNPNMKEEDVRSVHKYLNAMENNNLAFEQCMYDLNKQLLHTMSKYFPYLTNYYKDRRECLESFLHKEGNLLSSDEIDMLHIDLKQQYLASFASDNNMFNPFLTCKSNPFYDNTSDENYTNREYFLYKFPSILSSIKEMVKTMFYSEEENIPALIDMIFPTYRETFYESIGKKYKRFGIHAVSYNSSKKISLMEAWAEMAKMIPKFNDYLDDGINTIDFHIHTAKTDESIKKLQKQKDLLLELKNSKRNLFEELSIGLFMHNYYQSGFAKTPYSYMESVPYEVKELLTVGDMSYLDANKIDNINSRSSVAGANGVVKSAMEMAYMYALNHSNDYRIVKTFNVTHFRYASSNPFIQNNVKVESFKMKASDANKKEGFAHLFCKSIERSKNGEATSFTFFPVIKYAKDVYVCKINGEYNNTTTNIDSEIEYIKVPILGHSNLYTFYGSHLENVIEALSPRWTTNESNEDILISPEEELLQRVAREAREQETSLDDMYVETEEIESTATPDVHVQQEEVEAPDVEEMRERLIKCTQMDRNIIAKVMLETMGTSSMSVVAEALGMDEAAGRQHEIDAIVAFIKDEINAGNREVYTKMSNEIICK